ncbi:class I ribonucleotide reductase maintenance protein YfaE [Erwinia billingiae]|jgi:ferredoxin|uniref:2Fe-2S ferredoxin n=1 Tax=Erwinia billingiae (strain Eb661) TaxID=634500 RepID=D8MUR9_ERWBE|nr:MULTISPECIES: class I ribonucleotide reductase maintenance protein YfaE [Erwinia]MBN7123023.1 2Fe-2S ferredoxin [Erwinia billingiae]QBR52544.1 2Fe-2S ferredoxin-like protein [Erwinia sp. QL-Z3]QEW31406.1 2Fe-2S ferredoxin-like protein [Erwinia billingiae]CAX60576.1 2Fe-2S ferredoxin [Erwinia billingiae Eb661]
MAGSMIILRASGTQLHCKNEHPSLLDALEAHQVCVEYQCREGYCGSCRTRLLKGEVCYTAKPLAFVQHDEILPCCCKANGDIELEM